MNKKYGWAVLLSVALLTACGNGTQTNSSENEKDSFEVVASSEPFADSDQKSEVDIQLGSHKYRVTVYRYPDKTQPLVVDELEQKFYDNSVEIKVIRDGNEFFTHKVTKETFSDFLNAGEGKSSLLLGMNCDTARCTPSTICFTAQVGQAGEGPAFLVLVSTQGGQISVQRDNQQEEIGYK